MKSKILSLTKVFLKNSIRNKKTSSKSKLSKIGSLALTIILFIYLGGIVAFFSFSQISVLKVMGQEKIFINILLAAIALFILIQSIMYSFNMLYFAKDVEITLSMPFTPKQIILAKMNVMIITEYATTFLIGLAPMIIYGILTNASIRFYIFSVLILALIPLLPMFVGSLLVMIVMSFAKFTKDKNKFQLIATMLLIAFILVIQISFTGSGNVTDEDIANKVIGINNTISKFDNYFVTLKPSVNSLLNKDFAPAIASLIQVLIITLAGFIIFIEIGNKIYLKGAITTGSGIVKKIKAGELKYKKQNILISYAKKEFIMLFKNPIFFMQCILPIIIMPIIYIIIIFVQEKQSSQMDISEGLSQASNTLMMFVLIGFNIFTTMITMISVTAISRDGNNANFMKYIPIPLYKQFVYKLIPAIIMNLIAFIIISVSFIIIAKGQFLNIILPAFIVTTLIECLVNYISEIVDLKHPKLEWNSEYEVVKQNMNMIYPLFIEITILVILFVIGMFTSNLNMLLISAILIILFLIPLIAIDRYVYKNQEKLFEKIV